MAVLRLATGEGGLHRLYSLTHELAFIQSALLRQHRVPTLWIDHVKEVVS